MLANYNKKSALLPLPMFFSLLGIIFCALIANGYAISECFSVGCTLFQDMSINGISIWWVGMLAFSLFFMLAAFGRVKSAKFFTSIALFVDIVLLGIMLNIAPCTNCIIVALLFACTYISFRTVYSRNNPHYFKSVLFIVWVLLFVVNAGFLLRSTSANWIMHGSENANIKMYFAPSCESCKEALIALADNEDVAFYPVNNDNSDIFIVALMFEQIKQGKNIKDALNEALLVKEEDYNIDYFSYNTMLLYMRLLKNKAHVIESSGGAIPYFELNGLPKALVKMNDAGISKSTSQNNNSEISVDYSLPIDLEIAGNCGEKDAQPCP